MAFALFQIAMASTLALGLALNVGTSQLTLFLFATWTLFVLVSGWALAHLMRKTWQRRGPSADFHDVAMGVLRENCLAPNLELSLSGDLLKLSSIKYGAGAQRQLHLQTRSYLGVVGLIGLIGFIGFMLAIQPLFELGALGAVGKRAWAICAARQG